MTLGLIGEGVYIFHMLAVGSEGIVEVPGTAQNYAADALSRNRAEGRDTSTPSGAQAAPEADHYEKGTRRILAVLRGEAPPVPHEQMLRSVQICSAIEESLVRERPGRPPVPIAAASGPCRQAVPAVVGTKVGPHTTL